MVEYRLVLLPEQDVGLLGFYNSLGGDMASWVITGQTGGFSKQIREGDPPDVPSTPGADAYIK